MKAKIIFGILLLAVCSAGMSLAAQTAGPANYFYVKPGGGAQWAGKDAARVFDDAQQTGVIDAISAAAAWAGANHAQAYVLVAAGKYVENASIAMANGVTLIGGFDGDESGITPKHPQDGNPANTTTNTVFSGGNTQKVFYNASIDATAALENAVITEGFIGNGGSGMYNNSSSPTLTNCTFTNNIAYSASEGSGMYNVNSSPTLTNCSFTNNRSLACQNGGGMCNSGSSPTLTNCTFTNNTANGCGGGMYNINSSPTLTDCTFTNNSANTQGGGMWNGSSPTLTNCTFINNTANDGGGMYNYMFNPSLINCIATLNSPSDITNDVGVTPSIMSSVVGSDMYDALGNATALTALSLPNPLSTDFNADGSLTSSATWAIKQGSYSLYAGVLGAVGTAGSVLDLLHTLYGVSLTAKDMRDSKGSLMVSGTTGSETINLGSFRFIDTGEDDALFGDPVPPAPKVTALSQGVPYTSGDLTNAQVDLSVAIDLSAIDGYPLVPNDWVSGLKSVVTAPAALAGDYTGTIETIASDTYTFACVSASGKTSSNVAVTTNINLASPGGTITLNSNPTLSWSGFLASAGYMWFFQSAKTVTIDADNSNSLAFPATVEYYLSPDALDATAIQNVTAWQAYPVVGFTISPDSKQFIYARLTNAQGKVTYLSSEGIVFYTGCPSTVDGGSFSRNSTSDFTVNISMYGNTVDEITSGGATLTAGTDYTAGAGFITFTNSYMQTLAVGAANFSITWNPMGEAYVDDSSTDALNEAPGATDLAIAIVQPGQSIALAGLGSSYAYGDAPFTIGISGGSGTGAVTFTSSDPGVASISGATVAILSAGTFTITATKASDGMYSLATVTSGTITVSKATPGMKLSASGGATVNDDILLTATVSAVGAGVMPAGTVAFSEGGTPLGTATLDASGIATFTVAAPVASGNHTFTVKYAGDDDHYTTGSASASIVVAPPLSVSPASLHFIAAGETKTFTIVCNSSVWSLNCDARWITTSVSESESTGATIVMNVTAAANPDAAQRKALITVSIPGVMIKTVNVAQDAGVNPVTGLQATGTPSTMVYSQAGNVVVKSDTPIQSVAVYDISGKMLKSVKGGNTIVTINGLPRQQVLVVRVTDGGERSYKLRIEN